MRKYLAVIFRDQKAFKPVKNKQGVVDDGKIQQDARVSSRRRDSADRATERKRERKRAGGLLDEALRAVS